MNSLERAHSACVMAQRLNNKAAEQIESGADYDKAIRTLNHALRLSRADFRQSQTAHLLMLESCISYSQNVSPHQPQQEDEEDADSSNSRSGLLVIYQQTLRVTPEYMSQPMGRILPLLVMYNMALAHQLKALKMKEEEEEDDENNKKGRILLLNRSLKLYEVAYQWQNKEEHKSLRFNMILVNNIGDIHRCVNNKSKFQRCMQQLMRNMMYVNVVRREGGAAASSSSVLIHTAIMETFRRNIQRSGAAGAA
mmetsp:Transcript_29957/g.71959  ORF Transcript_29957/g.71959 Transcript_29957/m.71959 type:complete len:252 (+) Transcript_29957:122-877(+)